MCDIRQRYIRLGIIKPQEEKKEMASRNNSKKSDEFHNPYHFVPVKKTSDKSSSKWIETGLKNADQKRRSSFAEKLPLYCRHDLYVAKDDKEEKIYHGRIRCTLKTESPIFIGAKVIKRGDEKNPGIVAPFELSNKPAIPASTLRGVISSIAEAASNSALRVLEEQILSVRKESRDALKNVGIIKKEGDKISLLPLKIRKKFKENRDKNNKELITYSNKNHQYYYADIDHFRVNGQINLVRAEDASEEQKEKWQEGIVRYFPVKFGGKKVKNLFWEFAGFPKKQGKYLPVPDEVVKTFLKLANDRAEATKNETHPMPYMPKGSVRNEAPEKDKVSVTLKTGDIVFYDKNDTVIEIAFSQIWRRDCGGTIHDFFSLIDKELLPFNPERKYLSPAELIFGFVEDWTDKEEKDAEALSYKGRVRFSHAILDDKDNAQDDLYENEVILKILDSPKPPCPCLYFQQKNNGKAFISKNDLKKDKKYLPKGRKFYLHHNQKFETREHDKRKLKSWETHPELTKPGKSESRLKQKVKITPLRQGLTFCFDIHFENLTKWELGLLCYALNPDENFCHKIGMGKPIGLGSIKIEIDKLELIDRKKRYCEDDPFNCKRFNDKQCDVANLKKIFTDWADENGLKHVQNSLKLLGNPENIKYRVHTPLLKGQKGKKEELETFKWFVENEKNGRNGQQLESLESNSTAIPTLKR